MNPATSRTIQSDGFEIPRARMVEHLRNHYKIADERVLQAMNSVPRHAFVPDALKSQAYKDNALPISSGQTISQPFIVARMTELLELKGRERVLEIGSGSGYQTAILATLARKVFAIERLPALAAEAKAKLMGLGYRNISYRCDDGRALYVDVLTDENAVNVRDSRADVPKLLRREEGTDPFTGADRSLSGIGDEVRYSGPGRPQQSCRAAPA